MSWPRVRALVLLALPSSMLRRLWLRFAYKARVGTGVRIGACWLVADEVELGDNSALAFGVIVQDVESLKLSHGARVGSFSRARYVNRIELGPGACIGRRNLLLGARITPSPELRVMSVGARATITNNHYFDLVDTISIGADCVIGGRYSEFWTHGFDQSRDRLQGPIHIGAGSYVGSRVLVGPGASLPPDSVLAMGSCLVTLFEEPASLFAGVPAKRKGPAIPLASRFGLLPLGALLNRRAFRSASDEASVGVPPSIARQRS